MNIKTRILIGFLAFYIIGFYFVIDMVKNEIRPRYLEAIEESLNDTAHILAAAVELEMRNNNINTMGIKKIFQSVSRKKIESKIYTLTKKDVNLDVYITDEKGVVIFDSNSGFNEGRDFSQWNDVYLTLKGKYGARSSRSVQNDESTTSLYVAAPIKANGRIAGVLTVIKPEKSVHHFMDVAKRNIIIAGILTCCALVLLSIGLSFWIHRPAMKLLQYVKCLKSGERVQMPKLGNSEINDLGRAFIEMKDELEGKRYIEQYIQALTHELKSPLSSIRGSAELLEEDSMPLEQRDKFYDTILKESLRIENIIERLLQLSAVENRKGLKNIEKIYVAETVNEILESLSPRITRKQITVTANINEEHYFVGEKFLVRHAMENLINNAIQFSPENGEIVLESQKSENFISFAVTDKGEGIPLFAVDKIFDKFYSLPGKAKPDKGTGLGLPFVREVAFLHDGWIEVANNREEGVTASLNLPKKERF